MGYDPLSAGRLSGGGRLEGRREHRAIVLVTGVRVEDLCDRAHLLWNEFSSEGVELVGSAGGKYQSVHRLLFGSFTAGLAAAGLPPNPVGRPRKIRVEVAA